MQILGDDISIKSQETEDVNQMLKKNIKKSLKSILGNYIGLLFETIPEESNKFIGKVYSIIYNFFLKVQDFGKVIKCNRTLLDYALVLDTMEDLLLHLFVCRMIV